MRVLFDCVDCNVDTSHLGEYYTVRDDVWYAAMQGFNNGMLCIGCLEKRLGRVLTPADFPDYPINMHPNGWHKSDRFIDRLGFKEHTP